MCFTTTANGTHYFQIFGVFSPPRLVRSDADLAALRSLCRRYVRVFAIGSAFMVFALGFAPAFWAILTAWYYDKARALSSRTDIPRPPFDLRGRLLASALPQTTSMIAAAALIWAIGCASSVGLIVYGLDNQDIAFVGCLSLILCAVMMTVQAIKLNLKVHNVSA